MGLIPSLTKKKEKERNLTKSQLPLFAKKLQKVKSMTISSLSSL
jgi:hypothetical protein